MSQCTEPGEARACFASAESGERDAEAGPKCLDVAGAGVVDQAAGRTGLVSGSCLLCWMKSVTSQSHV